MDPAEGPGERRDRRQQQHPQQRADQRERQGHAEHEQHGDEREADQPERQPHHAVGEFSPCPAIGPKAEQDPERRAYAGPSSYAR